MNALNQIVKDIESYIEKYVVLLDNGYLFPLALWIMGTFCFPEFDAFPYLVITSATKRSGKTRLMELISFACSNPRNFAAITGPTLFRTIDQEKPALMIDEAESLSSQGATDMRAILNVGYRKGQTIPRMQGMSVKEFNTYCPKVFVLIGDVYDTLRDRSIVVTMRRGEPRERFMFQVAKEEGAELRERAAAHVKDNTAAIAQAFIDSKGLPFLMDRDEEIWTSLFCMAAIFCPERIEELKRSAVDMATEKTQEARRYVTLENKQQEEKASMELEYGKRLLLDLYSVFTKHQHVMSTVGAIEALRAIPVAPWRKFRGDGIDAHDMSNLLSPFGVRPVRIAIGSGRGNQKFYRGYKLADVKKAVERFG